MFERKFLVVFLVISIICSYSNCWIDWGNEDTFENNMTGTGVRYVVLIDIVSLLAQYEVIEIMNWDDTSLWNGWTPGEEGTLNLHGYEPDFRSDGAGAAGFVRYENIFNNEDTIIIAFGIHKGRFWCDILTDVTDEDSDYFREKSAWKNKMEEHLSEVTKIAADGQIISMEVRPTEKNRWYGTVTLID